MEAAARRLCDVVVPHTRLDELTYDCSGIADPLAPGDCVEVRLRGRKVCGVVVATPAATRVRGVLPVERLVEPALLDRSLLELADWLAEYYCCLRGEAMAVVLPRGIGGYRPRGAGAVGVDLPGPGPAVPAPGQGGGGFSVLVDAGRGGRLEVVAEFLEAARRRGSGILLLPEAQLDQWLPELQRRFGADIVEYHSRLGITALKRAWRRIRAGRHRLVVGVRSAVFAPLTGLGGIAVVDAHDRIYKEERYPRYNARDVAVVRARAAVCPVLFSDPLPAVETWQRIATGRYHLSGAMPEPLRYPASYIVDMRRLRDGLFSPRLRRELERMPGDAAAVLYVNRKGLSRHVACRECGVALECPDCRLPVVLTAARELVCGWCGGVRPAPDGCPECGGASFELRAAGIDLVARELARSFPEREVVKVESGAPATFRAGTLAVGTRTLLGATWPAKTALAAVVNFDYELSLPDYRVREQAFAALGTLVTRAEEHGAVLVVQTRRPDEPALNAGLSRDVVGFMATELALRRDAGLPPWRRLAVIDIGGGDRGAVLTHARRLARDLDGRRDVEVIGPAEARGRRLRLLVRLSRRQSLGKVLDRTLLRQAHLDVRIDVDPYDTF